LRGQIGGKKQPPLNRGAAYSGERENIVLLGKGKLGSKKGEGDLPEEGKRLPEGRRERIAGGF